MPNQQRLLDLQQRAKDNAVNCIFPFWTSEYIMDHANGGFYGRVTLEMQRDNSEPRSLVLTGRMVYAFAGAYRQFGDPLYLVRAKYTFEYLLGHFYDKTFGGAYNQVDAAGQIVDDDKPLYSEAFLVMACAAYYHATGDPEALRVAMETFNIFETRCKKGPANYAGSCARDWTPSQKSPFGRMLFPADAIMFNHHLCQAYEQLYNATGDASILLPLREMADCMVNVLHDQKNHCFCTMFDKSGQRLGTHQSFGHDCELSYLAMDVALLLKDDALTARMKAVCEDVLRQVLKTGFDPWHSLYNGVDLETGAKEKSHVWWAQAEAVTAMLLGYQLTGDEDFLTACENQLAYIEKYFVNKDHGDWYNNVIVDEDGWRVVDGMHGLDKLNGGKCPFHNAHMCFEVIRRVDEILQP
jgi:cellobiose epimerase